MALQIFLSCIIKKRTLRGLPGPLDNLGQTSLRDPSSHHLKDHSKASDEPPWLHSLRDLSCSYLKSNGGEGREGTARASGWLGRQLSLRHARTPADTSQTSHPPPAYIVTMCSLNASRSPPVTWCRPTQPPCFFPKGGILKRTFVLQIFLSFIIFQKKKNTSWPCWPA